MILKFEHRLRTGNIFQNDVYINMDNVFAITVGRTIIKFFTKTTAWSYWIPRTEYNMQILEKYLQNQKE